MTQPFDFKKNKSVIPEWHEQIIFNERFGHFVEQNEESPVVMLFFEVRDISFLTLTSTCLKVAMNDVNVIFSILIVKDSGLCYHGRGKSQCRW